MSDLEALRAELLSRSGSGARFGLDRVREAARALGHPERGLAALHVAGTNGKGSVVAMATAMTTAHGLRVGSFTSPHLHRLEERIRIDGTPIGAEPFRAALARVLDPRTPWTTFFEAITLTAFVAFHEAEVDLAIIEVGLGGRLDATNIIDPPHAAAIVSVSLDHVRILGGDVETIAGEKAGIFKAGVPVVLGPLDEGPRRVAVEAAHGAEAGPVALVSAREVPAPLTRIAVEEASPGLRITDGERAVEVPVLGLPGGHQRANAAVAVGLVNRLPPPLRPTDEAMARGLAQARWPGRLERLAHADGDVLFDCAHNLAGAEALAEALRHEPHVVLLFGVMGDKEWQPMLDALAPSTVHRVYVAPPLTHAPRRPLDPSLLTARHPGTLARDVDEALAQARALAAQAPGGLVVVAGSIFLVAAARALLTDQPRDVLVAL